MISALYTHTRTEKLIFFDVIIEDDSGETEKEKEVVPYQLSKEAIVLDMKVQDIKVQYNVHVVCKCWWMCRLSQCSPQKKIIGR